MGKVLNYIRQKEKIILGIFQTKNYEAKLASHVARIRNCCMWVPLASGAYFWLQPHLLRVVDIMIWKLPALSREERAPHG